MADSELQPTPPNQNHGPQWYVVALIVLVLVVSTLIFIQPISNARTTADVEATASLTPEMGGTTPEGTLTTTDEAELLPPTPDEVGYTDGIIFCSTVLVLILLVGTLRETVHRKGR